MKIPPFAFQRKLVQSCCVPKVRADVLLTQRGLVPSRARAQALILAGKVFAAGQRVEKSGEALDEEAPLEVRGPDHPYASRGGVKLAGALDALGYQPLDKIVADFGASTGGFTDCLLQRGAAKVFAIDVGYGQLHHKLRQDERVVVMERCNARHLKRGDLPEPVDLVVIDASFIGLEKLLPAARALLRPDGEVLALVKPQFQVGHGKVGKGGVVRDPEHRREAIANLLSDAQQLGFELLGEADSVITGPKGNQETFIWLRRLAEPPAP
jgi:23S rRNA (cytidine1920-2'-O)/16S rRNA (cytidine1409-2'-O)-methyltransferase